MGSGDFSVSRGRDVGDVCGQVDPMRGSTDLRTPSPPRSGGRGLGRGCSAIGVVARWILVRKFTHPHPASSVEGEGDARGPGFRAIVIPSVLCPSLKDLAATRGLILFGNLDRQTHKFASLVRSTESRAESRQSVSRTAWGRARAKT